MRSNLVRRTRLRSKAGLAFAIVPAIPNSPIPFDGSTVLVVPTLFWQAAGATSYDVAFGTSPTPPTVSTGQNPSSYTPSVTPTVKTVYYWQITAHSSAGTTIGPVWSFTIIPGPTPIVDGDPNILYDTPIKLKYDMSQQRSRIYVRGAGGTLAVSASPGDTAITIQGASDSLTPYAAFTGGELQTGCQRISYTGIINPTKIGGVTDYLGGQLVDAGTYSWCYTFIHRADGTESGPSPIVTHQMPTNIFGTAEWMAAINLAGCDNPPSGYYRAWYRTKANSGNSFPNDFFRVFMLECPPFNYGDMRVWWPSPTDFGTGWEYSGFFFDDVNDSQLGTAPIPPPSVFGLTDPVPINILGVTVASPTVLTTDGAHGYTTGDWVKLTGSGNATPSLNGHHQVTVIDGTHVSIAVNVSVAPSTVISPNSNGVMLKQWFYTPTTTPPYSQLPDLVGPYFIGYIWNSQPSSGTTTFVLTGVSGITEPINAGDSISIFLQYDDAVVQAALALQEGGDGIREDYLSDSSLPTYAAMTAVAKSRIQAFGYPIGTVTYSTLDFNSILDAITSVNLTHPPIVISARIQTVVIDQVRISPPRGPRYTVTASSMKFTLDDLLRKINASVNPPQGIL